MKPKQIYHKRKSKKMKQKDSRNFKERAQDLQKVLTWCIIHNIKKHYETLDNFKKTYLLIKNGRASSAEQVHFCRRFGFDSNVIIRKVLGKADGKWVKLSDIKPYLDKWIHYRHSNTKHYKKTGKHFAVHSYWYIEFDVIERYIDDADVADCRSRFYTKEQHHLINRLFLKQKTKKTKKEEKQVKGEDNDKSKSKEQTMGKIKKVDGYTESQWNEMHAKGERAMTWEQAVKLEEKNRRAAEKHKMTIAKNAAKATLKEYAELQLKVQQLEAYVKHLESLKDKNSDIVEEPEKLYDNPDDIDWQNEVPEDDIERDAWINEHCSEACKKKIQEEFEAGLKQQLSDKDIDYGAEAEKVKKLLADPEFAECSNANSNDDIDESEATVIPTTSSQKVIEFALKQRGTKDELVSLVLSKKLVPIDDSFRFYYCKLNGKSSVIEPAADKIYQLDNVGNFKVGCMYYSFSSSCCKAFSEKTNDKYYYANRYLTYVWNNDRNEYSRIQFELSNKLGYSAVRDFK